MKEGYAMFAQAEEFHRDADLRSLISEISALAPSFETWRALLGRLRQLERGKISLLVCHDLGDCYGRIQVADNVDSHYLRSYDARYAAHDRWVSRVKDLALPGTIWISDQLLSEAERSNDKFYNEWLKPQGIFHVIHGVIRRASGKILHVDVGRGDEVGGYDQNDVDAYRSLLPKLQRAAGLQLLLDNLSRRSEAVLKALDMLPIGVMILDSRSQPVIVNRYARDLLPAWRNATGDLQALLQHRPTSTEQAVHEGAPPSRMTAMGAGYLISIPRPEELHPLSALMFHLNMGGDKSGDDRFSHVVFISNPDHGIFINRERLQEIYGLTPAEARLAALLAEGKHLKAAAAQLGITFETARTHLKRIFSKTTAASQADLVRLLLNLTTQIGCLFLLTVSLGFQP
jgi:DNA-binding CsgD family transcriptional regulator